MITSFDEVYISLHHAYQIWFGVMNCILVFGSVMGLVQRCDQRERDRDDKVFDIFFQPVTLYLDITA